MSQPPAPSEVAAALMRYDEPEIVRVIRWFDSGPPESAHVLEELARHASAEVRAWAAVTAAHPGFPGSVDFIARLVNDRSPIVQEAAIGELMKLDLARAGAVAIPRLRRQLRASDPLARVWALWRLVELGDVGSKPVLLLVQDLIGRDDVDFAERVLDGRGDEVLDVLRQHDHARVPAAIRAAVAMKTPAARQALEACATTAGDEECRRACRRMLDDYFEPRPPDEPSPG